MKFNENLKYLRKKEGLTQEELAEKLNVSRQSVTKWESGQALPDIEKVKEIAYLFSVSVDTLVGDIESKTENKLKKKIDDIGYFIFAYVMVALGVIFSLYNSLNKLIENDDIVIIGTIGMIVIAFILFIINIKVYLKNVNEVILNMKDNEEGRKERKKYIIKNSVLVFIEVYFIGIIMDIDSFIIGDISLIVESLITNFIILSVIIVFLTVYEYKGLEKKVKELEKK